MTKTKRPAEQLAADIEQEIKGGGEVPPGADNPYRLISIATLQRWKRLAKKIDGRMRLDGSPLNRLPTKSRRSRAAKKGLAGAGRKRVTR